MYQLQIGNHGPESAHGVVVTDIAPSGIELSSTVIPNVVVSTGTITFDPDGTIRWEVGDLAVDHPETATIYAVLRTPGTKTNTSTIDGRT